MGTKIRAKKRSTDEADDDITGCNVDKEKTTKKKGKNRWLPKMIRGKRKYRTLSEERLHDIDGDGQFAASTSTTDAERWSFHRETNMPDVDESHRHGYQREISIEDNNEIVNEGHDCRDDRGNDGVDSTAGRGKDDSNNRRKKTISFGAALRLIRDSLSYKKRRKHSTDYTKFSDAEPTDDLTNLTPPTPPPSPIQSGIRHSNTDDDTDPSTLITKKGKKRNKSSTTKYVHFDTVVEVGHGEDDDKENIAMTIDEHNYVVDDRPDEVTSIPKEKKKSARKKVAKAGRKTGRVLGEGMLQLGKNLQYLTPIPTQHVFGPYSSSRSTASRSGARKPKKRNYKYTPSAPPTNPYAFV